MKVTQNELLKTVLLIALFSKRTFSVNDALTVNHSVEKREREYVHLSASSSVEESERRSAKEESFLKQSKGKTTSDTSNDLRLKTINVQSSIFIEYKVDHPIVYALPGKTISRNKQFLENKKRREDSKKVPRGNAKDLTIYENYFTGSETDNNTTVGKVKATVDSEKHTSKTRIKRDLISSIATTTKLSCSADNMDCNIYPKEKYKIREITWLGYSNISGLIEYVDNFMCPPFNMARIAIETRIELAQLIKCSLCDDLSDFSTQIKKHILTSGVVDTSQLASKISLSKALDEHGHWVNWTSSPDSRIPSEVVLLNSTTGLEEPSVIAIVPDVYLIVLLGSYDEVTKCPQDDCLYWKWGLISYSAALDAIKRIKYVICEDPTNNPITHPATSTSLSTDATMAVTSTQETTATTITAETTSTTVISTETTSKETTSTEAPSTEAPSTERTTSSQLITTITSQVTTENVITSTTESFNPAISTTPSIITTTSGSTITTTTRTSTTPNVEVCCNIDAAISHRLWLCPGEATQVSCPDENNTGYLVIACSTEREIVILEDHCLKKWIDDVRNMVASGNYSGVVISNEVRNQTSYRSPLSSHDLEILVGVLHNLTLLVDSQTQLLPNNTDREFFLIDYNDNFVHITANILSVPMTWQGLVKEDAALFGDALLLNLETSGFLLAKEIINKIHLFTSLELNMTVSSKPRSTASGSDFFIPNAQHQTYMHLPKNFESLLPENETVVRLVAFLLQQDAAHRALPAKLNRDVPSGSFKEVNSAIFSATLSKAGHQLNFSELHDYVTIRFQHAFPEAGPLFRDLYRERRPGEIPTPVPGTADCVYWNTFEKLWAPDGCNLLNTSREETYCQCQHLTMISIITDIHDYVGRDQVLDLIGTILSSASCISLAIAFCIFHYYKSIASPRVTITKHLCISLGIGQLLLLLLLDRDFLNLSEIGCSVSAMILHYWMTSAIFWMLAEGLHLLQTVNDVLSHVSYMPAYWLLGYGVPIMLVVTTLLVAYGLGEWSSQGAYAPSNSEYCWLTTEQGYIWAFTGPLLIIIVLNTLSMIMALKSAARLRTNRQKTFPEQVRLWVKGCFSLNCILGSTWVFGFLYINTAHVFAYIFTIFNASQGIMILLFHCIVNDTVRTEIVSSLPQSLAKIMKNQTTASRRQTVAAIRRTNTSPQITPVETTMNSIVTTPSTSPDSTPPKGPTQRKRTSSRDLSRVKSGNYRRSPPLPPARSFFASRGCNSHSSRDNNPYNVAPAYDEDSMPMAHRSFRNGSQLSNSTQSTFLSDPYSSYNCSRRTSLESYESSNSLSSSEDSYPSYIDVSFKANEEYSCGQNDIVRYIPGFAAIQECDEKSLRSEKRSSFSHQ